MLTLKIDTTIAKVAKVEIRDSEKSLPLVEADNPLAAIKKSLERSGKRLAEIDRFESIPGPGSYTGVRVGAAVANTLNWVMQKNVALIEPVYES